MPLDILPASYQTGCRIRGRYGGLAAFERQRGIFNPKNAKAVVAGREAGGDATFERQRGLFDPKNAKAVAAGLERSGRKRTCSCGGCPKCLTRKRVVKSRTKKMAEAEVVAEVVEISSDSDSDVEIVS
ncbi:hypothetical protein HXX76_000650 [Chlamydomonas incerta]|uniref:Uncharacterized protein n=1 Tax=Chlamydomonas incerta TaxID=51695 RepID=A0A836B359_CHLIN|nr:hypothetical protein HXX76_000650 [Chlamydomonas incerta]|eukprot:KAG2446048.1 hypothetical protein HXX76_000650 [Chlamydomonas incerta]